MIKKCLSFLLLAVLGIALCNRQAFAENDAMTIKLTINGDKAVAATLADNQAARDFLALLPLTLDLRDFAGTEKASGALPKKLRIQDAPSGHKPSAGELTYYAPWGNLAIFYKADKYADGLVLLGHIEGDPAAFDLSGNVTVTIEALPIE